MTDFTADLCHSILKEGTCPSSWLMIDVSWEAPPTTLLRQVMPMLYERGELLTISFRGHFRIPSSIGDWINFVTILWTADRSPTLRFSNLIFTSVDIDQLNQLGTLTGLHFHNCTLGGPISLPSTLQHLAIGRTSVRIKAGTYLPQLKFLKVKCEPMTLEDWAHLMDWDLPSLRKVELDCENLRENQVGSATAFLTSKNSVRGLRLDGVASNLVRPFFSNLRLRHLRKLQMDTECNNLSPIAEWVMYHPHLRTIDLGGWTPAVLNCDSLMQSLWTFDRVKVLRLDSIAAIQSQTYLATTSTLECLSLTHVHCSTQDEWDSFMNGIQAQATLRYLNLSNLRADPSIKIGPALARMVAGHPHLQSLKLCAARIDDDGLMALMEGLNSNSTLESLNLSQNNFGTKGCEHLYRTLRSHPSIRRWDLYLNQGIGSTLPELGAAIAHNPRISHVFLGNVQTPTGQMDAFLMQLDGHPGLTQLSIYGNDWRDASIDALTQFIRGALQLRGLFLGSDKFTPAQLATIYQATTANASIVRLGIKQHEFDFGSLTQRNRYNRSQRDQCLYGLLMARAFEPH